MYKILKTLNSKKKMNIKNYNRKNLIILTTSLHLFFSFITFAQNQITPYLFTNDILKDTLNQSLSWKFEQGAVAFSFANQYDNVLKMRQTPNPIKSKISEKDSLIFATLKQVNAKEFIVEQSKNVEIVIINEAHHLARHRTFTKSILEGLYKNGYRYLGLEALNDAEINRRNFAILESGFYTKEPEFGSLIAEARQIGFTLFGYEASDEKNGKEREIEQALHIKAFMEQNPNGKTLIYCGYAHAYENEYAPWGFAMAGRLKDILKTDPLTIDQTMFVEKFNKNYNNLLIKENKTREATVLIDKNGNVFNGFQDKKQTDIVIIHPETNYINLKPDWFITGKNKYEIPMHNFENNAEYLVLAYRNKEFELNGIPADITEIPKNKKGNFLYLKKGTYQIIIKDKNYTIIKKYKLKIR